MGRFSLEFHICILGPWDASLLNPSPDAGLSPLESLEHRTPEENEPRRGISTSKDKQNMFIITGRHFQLSELMDKKSVQMEVEKEQGGGVKGKLEEITGAFKTLSEIELKDQAGNAIDLDDDKAKELSLKIKSIRNVQNLISDLGISNMKSMEVLYL